MNEVMAASAIANVVKSSLGSIVLDKILVDDIGVSIELFDTCFN
jgi:chaperonin GroEL (HSP60 family)